MYTTGRDFRNFGGGVGSRITLFHDRTANGKYDPTLLKSFNQQILDPNFEYRSYFTTIAPLAWEDCIALQPADLVAFEVYKDAERKLKPRVRRKSYTALLKLSEFGVHTKSFTRDALVKMREFMEGHGYKGDSTVP
jgi:hypothetical protein